MMGQSPFNVNLQFGILRPFWCCLTLLLYYSSFPWLNLRLNQWVHRIVTPSKKNHCKANSSLQRSCSSHVRPHLWSMITMTKDCTWESKTMSLQNSLFIQSHTESHIGREWMWNFFLKKHDYLLADQEACWMLLMHTSGPSGSVLNLSCVSVRSHILRDGTSISLLLDEYIFSLSCNMEYMQISKIGQMHNTLNCPI